MNCSSLTQPVARLVRASLKRRLVILSITAAMLGAHAEMVSATLVGDIVFGEMLFKDSPGLGNLFDPAAKPGCPECTVPGFIESSGIQPVALVMETDFFFPEYIFREVGLQDVIANINNTTIDVTVINTSGSLATESPLGWEIRITDMDWINGPPGLLTSAMVDDDTLFPGLTASVINGGTGILIDFPGRATSTTGTGPANLAQDVLDAYNNNGQLSATISFTVMHIPEPATCSLFVGAILMLVGYRQRLA